MKNKHITLLTWGVSVIIILKEAITPTIEETEFEDSWEDKSITMGEVIKVIKNLCRLRWCFLFLKGGIGECVPIIMRSHFSLFSGKFTLGCWKGGSDQWSNLGFRRSSVAFDLVMEQWTKTSPLQIFYRNHGSLLLWSTCVLGIWRRLMTGLFSVL